MNQQTFGPLYRLVVDDEDEAVFTADDIINAWAGLLPADVAAILDLALDQRVVLFTQPKIVVTRLT
jgi:hypothetical protein